MQDIFIGIDGGATKSIARLENASGQLLGKAVGGPANINVSLTQAVSSIKYLIQQVLTTHGFSLEQPSIAYHCGIGLAGSEIETAKQAFLKQMPAFSTFYLAHDAHVACLGAHNGKDGAIIIIGTGTIGYARVKKVSLKVGGWGFPHDDCGGGAWLGMQAIRHSLKCHDKRATTTVLSEKILRHFQDDFEQMVVFANEASSTHFATLAPIVIDACKNGCLAAQNILKKAAEHINEVGATLLSQTNSHVPCALVGGLANFIEPYLNPSLRSRLVACEHPPEVGAIIALREQYQEAQWQHKNL